MKIACAVPLDDGQRAALREIKDDVEFVDTPSFVAGEFGESIDASTDIVYAFRVVPDLMDRAPALKWLQLLGAGCDHLLGHPIMTSGAVVTTASGIHATPMAEYVLGVMLGHARWLPQAYRAQMERRWIPQEDAARGSRELRRRTVGIIGYGSIGREVARLAKPFGTRILAVKRDPTRVKETGYVVENTGDPEGTIPEAVVGPDKLLDVLGESDYVVIAVPVTGETGRMFGASEFAAMKPGSFLVNVARGDVLDEAALVEALQSGPMGGAALDVFDQEPLPADSPLWGVENLIVTPHISGASRPHLRRAFELFRENFKRFVKGEPLLNLVDKELGY